MSTELDHAREMAERIARRVSREEGTVSTSQPKGEVSAELAAVRAGLSELQRKISQLEAKVTSGQSRQAPPIDNADSRQQRPVLITHSPWLAGINSSYSHPSQEKFGVEEATISELVDFFENEKHCGLEAGKPCDHCDMCSSRGF